MSSRPVNVLGFAGSLRRDSFNRSLLRAAAELAPEGMAISTFDLAEIPLSNGDVEALGDPEPVAAFKQAIRAADGVLMVTPEYNHGVPGVMKNAVDWASRPPGDAALARKPVALLGASPGLPGTARGQSQLRQAFRGDWRLAEGEERAALWAFMRQVYPPYDDYQGRTQRNIPVMVITAREAIAAFQG